MIENDDLRPTGESPQESNQTVSIGKGRWMIKGINYARGYAKLVNISTGDKRYVALLNFPGFRSRFSYRLFRRSSSAIERRDRIERRLGGFKGSPLDIEHLVKGDGDGK